LSSEWSYLEKIKHHNNNKKEDNPLDILWVGGQREVTVREQNSTSRQLDSCQSADMKRIVS
jgi:hypothetical protein